MIFERLKIPDIVLIKPKIFNDLRGHFFEFFNQQKLSDFLGIKINFVQDNQSYSSKGVLRGLHYQRNPSQQGKLVRVVKGEIFDVAVDVRKNSPTYGQWIGEYLSEKNNHMLWIPEGFAHGFCVVSDYAIVNYKCTSFYDYNRQESINCFDTKIGVEWPLFKNYILSDNDRNAPNLTLN